MNTFTVPIGHNTVIFQIQQKLQIPTTVSVILVSMHRCVVSSG